MINNNKSAVIVFAKLPIPGKVKTRLAADLGNDFAAEFYRNCAAHIFNEVAQLKKHGIDCYLFYGMDNNISEVKKWVNQNFIFMPQSAGDLGNKMSSAFRNVFSHGINKVIIAGTDIPDLSKEIFLNAFDLLDKNDVVISPSYDGGYNFLGMKKYLPELFENIKWSTEQVFTDTIDKMKEYDLKTTTVETLADIDNKSDLIQWLADPDNGETPLKLIIKNLLKETGS